MYELADELPIEPDFEIEPDMSFKFSPEELQDKMGRSAWEFSQASRFLRELQTTKSVREKQVRIILLSKRVDLITNAKLRAHLVVLYDDPKFRWTKEDLWACIYIEQKEIMEKYTKYEKIANQAKTEFQMWASQLMWYQSKMRHERLDHVST